MKKVLMAAVAVMAMTAGSAALARDSIRIVGSSTVFPFTTAVAEQYAKKSGKKAPVVESTGTGGGIKLFCSGVGEKFPDVVNASRPMKATEFDACAKAGVKEIVEIQVGLDGIVIASKKGTPGYKLSRQQLYLALAKQVMAGGKLVANPFGTWNQVNAALPNTEIEAYGPPPTSGTRDAFVEMALEGGAAKLPSMAQIKSDNGDLFKKLAGTIREDRKWIDAGENDNAIVATLTKTPTAVGIFGYSFYEENMDKVQAATVDGVVPTYDTIANGTYPLSRTLFIYVKKAHVGVIPGLKEFLGEYMSTAAMGDGGYLENKGLIILPTAQLAKSRANATALTVMAKPKK